MAKTFKIDRSSESLPENFLAFFVDKDILIFHDVIMCVEWDNAAETYRYPTEYY